MFNYIIYEYIIYLNIKNFKFNLSFFLELFGVIQNKIIICLVNYNKLPAICII